MNRIFKVLWNKSLKRFVVTNEIQRSRCKAKNETIALGAALLTLATFPFDATFASEITVPKDWSATKITTSGKVSTITTSKIQGDTANNKGIGINKFDEFKVTKGDIANLIVPKTANNLVNFVNEKISIDGTVNSLKESKVGGNLFFVTPSGMTVGKTGVINAGSLTAVVTTEDAYKEWTGSLDKVNSALLNKMQSGAVPLNRSGVITVSGSINTGNRIVLAASNIKTESTAKLTNARALEEFKTLVNIDASAGVEAVSAGVDGTLEAKETTDGSGDILLLARTDTNTGNAGDTNYESSVEIGGTINSREDVVVGAIAGNGEYDPETQQFSSSRFTGSLNSNASIRAIVNISGKVTADKDIDIAAKAINHVNKGGLAQTVKDLATGAFGTFTGINEALDVGDLDTTATVKVQRVAEITSGGSLTVQAVSSSLLNLGAKFSPVQLFELLKEEAEKFPAAAAVVALIDSSANVEIEGSLTSGGDLTIAASDTLKGTASAYAAEVAGVDKNPGHVAFTFAKYKGKSDVTVSDTAHLKLTKKTGSTSGGKVSITAKRSSRVETSAEATVEREAYGAIAFNYTEHNTSSSVTMKTGLEGESAESLTIASENITERESMYAQTSSGAIDGKKVKIHNMLQEFSGNFVSSLMGKVAEGTDKSFTAKNFKLGGTVGVICGTQSSTVTIAPSTTFKSVGNIEIESLSKKIDHHYTVYAQSDGVKSEDGNQSGEVNTAGSIALLISLADDDDTVISNLSIGDKSRIETTAGTLTINNKAEISYNRVKVMIEDLIQKAKELKQIYTYVNPDGKDWDAVDETIKAIEAQSEDEVTKSFVKYTGTLGNRIKQAFENSVTFFESLITIYELVASAGQFLQADSYVNSYVTASGSADKGKLEFGGSVGILLQSTASDLMIGKSAILLSGTAYSETAGWINVNGESINESTAVSGHLSSFMGIPLPTDTESDAFGASVLVQILDTDNKVTIREGAQLKDLSEIGGVKVVANDRIKNIVVGASADISKGSMGISANGSVAKSTGVNRLRIDDEATITAGSITLQANRKDNNQAVVGTFSLGLGDDASKNIGASVALNLVDFENTVAIEDNDVLEEGEKSIVNDVCGLIEAKNNSWGVDISARANTTLNSIGVSGGIATAGETTDPNVFQRIGGWFKERGKSVSKAIDKALDPLANKVPTWGSKIGGGTRNIVSKVLRTNGSGNGNFNNESGENQPNVNEENMQDEDGNASVDRGNQSEDPLNTDQAKSFQIGLAASVAWNQVDLNNNVTIVADNLTIAAPKVNVEAVTNKWIGAWAGGVGVSYVSEGEEGVSSAAGAGGAIAVNNGTLKNVVTISEGESKTGIFVGNDTNKVGSVTIRAVSDGTIIAEGLSAGVAATKSDQAGGQYSFDASVSVNMLDNTVKADVNHVTQISEGPLSWDQAAWNGESQVTGGIGFGLSLQPNDEESSRSVGLLVSYAEINNTIQSSAKSLTLLNANKFDLRALTNLKQVTTAVGVNVTTGDSATSFTGSAGATNFINTVTSEVSNSEITLSDGATTRILASGITKEDSEEFTKLAEWTPESKPAKDISSELNNSDFYKEVAFQTEKEQTKGNGQKLSELGEKTGLHQTTVVVSLAASAKKGSGAPAILVNKIDNNFTTSVDSTTFAETTGTKTGSYTQRAESNATSVAVATGIAASPSGKETFAVAGSLIVSNVGQKSKTIIKKSSITADTVAFESGNDATTVNVAGEVGLSLSEKGDALGAAILVMNTNNRAEITVENSSILNAATLTTKALNNARAWGVSVDVTGSTQLAFGGSVAVNRVKNESVITVDGLKLKDFTTASLTADDTSNLWTLAGGVAYGGETAGVSGAVAYSISGRGNSDGTKVDVSNITVQKTAGKTAGDLTVKAQGQDKVHTLVLAAGASKGKLGFSGASGVGEVKRTTTASVKNLKTEMLNADGSLIADNAAAVLGALSIKAIETAGVYNLGIAGAYADKAGVGIGIAVNRITTTTNASLTRDAVDASRIKANTLEVAAKTSDDIENIAIGGAGSGAVAIMGSIVVNKLTDNTKAELKNVKVDLIDGAASVDAQSDDVIGSYSGGISGGKKGAGGLSILVNDRFGDTEALVSASEVKQSGTPTKSLKANGSVDKDKINKKIVNDISVAASLENDRIEETIKGIRVGATSTATFKSFVINGAGAGEGAAVGCATVNYHGGSTKTAVTSSKLEAVNDLAIESGNFVNVDNLLMVGAFAGKGAGDIVANVATTNHQTTTSVNGGSLTSTAGKVELSSESKEGVSSLGIALSGAQYGAGGVLINVTRELSSATTDLSATSKTTISGKSVNVSSDYLGRLNSLAVMASGAQYGSGVINVIVNYNDNDAITNLGKSQITAIDSVTATSLRRTENSGIGVQLSGAQYGSLAATILVNTVEGDSKVTTNGAIINVPIIESETSEGESSQDESKKNEASPSITLSSAGEDVFHLVDVSVTGAMYATAGMLVVVNRFLASAQTDVETSTIKGDTVTIEAKQNRDINANNTLVSGSFGTLGANVLCTIVGAGGDPFAQKKTNLADLDETVNGYMTQYASASSSEKPGILKPVQDGAGNALTDSEKKAMLQVAAVSASAGSKEGGTHVKVNGSTIEAETVSIGAKEDTESWAQKTLKVGEYSGAIAGIAASVGTIREKRNLTTTISASFIDASGNVSIGTEIAGETKLDSYQGKVAGIAGSTAYADIVIDGGSNVILDNAKFDLDSDGNLAVLAQDNSKANAYTFGIDISLMSGASIVANIEDKSSLGVELKKGTAIAGSGVASIGADRSTERHAEVRAGTGGALNLQWSNATVTDTGDTTVTITGITSEGSGFDASAINQAILYTKSYQGYASALNVGALESTTKASGKTSLTVSSSALNSGFVNLNASSGAASYDAEDNLTADDALRLTAIVNSYGASVAGGHVDNMATAENTTTTDLVVKDNTFSSATTLALSEYGYAYYDVVSDLGTGGVIAEGTGHAKVKHKATLTNTIASTKEGADVKLFGLVVNNIEQGTLKAYGAGGTVIDFSAKAAYVEHEDLSSVTSNLSGSWDGSEGVLISSASTHALDFLADNTKGVVLGGSSAKLENGMIGSNTLTISGNWESSSGSIYASAITHVDLGAVSDKTYAVDSAVYGAINGANATATSAVARDTIVNIANGATLTAKNDLDIASQIIENSTLRVRGRTAGLATGVTAYNDTVVREKTLVNLAENAKLKNLDSDYEVTLSASSSSKRVIDAIGDLQGSAFGGAGAASVNKITQTNEVQTAKGSKIEAAGKVNLYAGRDISGDEEDFDFKVYTHAYARAIGDATSELEDTFDLTNRLTLSGDVLAVRSIDATADIGTWSLNETSRYWSIFSNGDAGNVRIASSAAGSKTGSGFSPVNSIVLDGKLTAGTQTKSLITITGLVDSGASDYTIEGNTVSEPTISTDGVQGTVSSGSESVANIYKERYETLLSLIANYSGDKTQSSTAVLAYKNEAEFLRQKMIDQGLATFNGKELVSLVDTDQRGFVKVSDITVAGGDVNLRAGSVTGSGSIVANAADQISIDNQSNLALTVENIRILEKGGNFTLNGVTQSGKPSGFAGTVTSASNTKDPVITIKSKYLGTGNVKVAVKSDYTDASGVVQKKIERITPDNTVTVQGVVANDVGDLKIDAAGDLLFVGQRLAAAGGMSLIATRSVIQSYTSGMRSIAGDIENLWADAIADYKTSGIDTVDGDARVPTGDGVVAGSSVFISADNININGLVQSGYATWSVDLTQNELEQKVSQIKSNWIRDGSKRDINPTSNEYLISAGGAYKTSDGTYAMAVAVWYDPVNDRVLVDDINPQGGQIYLTGRIASTGGGKLYAASGVADVKIDSGAHSVRLGEISTKNGSGLIEITDTMVASPGSSALANVYRWENYEENGELVIKYMSGTIDRQDGKKRYKFESESDYYLTFNPTQYLGYAWSEGYRSGIVYTASKTQKFKWWEAAKSGKPDESWETTVNTVKDESLGKGITLRTNYYQGEVLKFSASTDTKTTSEGDWVTTTWTTYNNWTHWSGKYHYYAEKCDTAVTIYTYTVKAYEPVDVKFLKGTNTIDVKSGEDIVLTGKLSAQGGTVNLTAQRNIINDASEAAIVGANTVNLKAGAAIGEEKSAIKLVSSNGSVNLSAVGSMDNAIYLDTTNTHEDARINASEITAGDVNLTTRGSVNITNLTAYEANLVSNAGDIEVTNLDQMAANDHIARRFDAKAAGSVTVTSENDIGIGKITATNAVSITSTKGSVWDAISREDLDNRNAEEKIRLWEEAGILGKNGTNNGEARWEADVSEQEKIVEADYERYEDYKALSDEALENLNDSQAKDYATLKTRFDNIESKEAAVAAEKANANSNLAKTIAAKDNYGWSQNELLYAVSDAIVNPDPALAPEAGEPNVQAKTITINAAKTAGTELDKQTIQFSDIKENTDKGLEAYKILARADLDDVKWGTESVEVTLKRPISVKLTLADGLSQLEGSASTGFYVASDEKLRIGTIRTSDANAAVRLTSQKGIEALARTQANPANIYASHLVLRGGEGSIGSLESPVVINSTGDVALSASKSIHIKELSGELKLVSAATDGVLDLTAGKIVSVFNESQGAQGYLTAKDIILSGIDESSQIGSADQALKIKVRDDGTTTLTIQQSKLDTFNVETFGDADYKLSLKDNSLETTNDLTLKGKGNLVLGVGTTLTAGGTLTLATEKSLTVGEGSSLQSNDIELEATKGEVVANSVTFKSLDTSSMDASVTIAAKGDVSLKDSIFEGENSAVNVATTVGSVDLTQNNPTASSTVKSLKIKAQDDIKAIGRRVKTNESLALESGGAIRADYSTFDSEGTLTVQASDNVNLAGSDLKSTGALQITSSTGAVAAGSATIESDDSIAVNAAGDVNLREAAITAQNGELSISSGADVHLETETTTNEILANAIAIEARNAIFENRKVVATKALTVSASEAIEGAASQLTAAEIALNATNEGIDVNGATLNSTQGNLTLISSEGLVGAQGATLQTNQSLEVKSSGDADLKNAAISATNGVAKITSTAGSVDLSATDATRSVNAQTIEIHAASNLDMSSRTLKASEAFAVNATGRISAKAATIESDGTLNLAGNRGLDLDKANLTSQNALKIDSGYGYVNASDATVNTQEALSIQASYTICADRSKLTGSSVSLYSLAENVFAREAVVTSPGQLALRSGDDIDVSGSTLTVTGASEKLTLEATFGSVNAKSATLSSASEIAIAANDDVSLSGAASLRAPKVSLTSEFKAVDLSDDVEITAPEIAITAETGSVLLADNVKLIASQGAVHLDAGDGIYQTDNSLIRASTLVATADDSVSLESNSGNEVPTVTLSSVSGSVGLHTAVDTTVTINEDDVVSGDIWLDATNATLTLTEGVASNGQVSVHAKSVKAPYLISNDSVYVSTSFNNDDVGNSIEIDGIYAAEIGLLADKGSIKTSSLIAFDGAVCVYRTNLETEGTISIGYGESTSNGFIYNGNGNITSGLVSDDFVQLMTGRTGAVTQLANTQGSSSRVMPKVSFLSGTINAMILDSANEYKWFPMIDWRKLGCSYIARSTDEVWEVYGDEKKHLIKPATLEEGLIEDNWTKTFDTQRIGEISF